MAECRTNAEGIKIEPVYVTWENQHLTKVVCEADVAGSLGGKAIFISSTTVDYYAWFNNDTDPAIAGRTGIAATIVDGASATAVAIALAAAVNSHTAFHAVVSACDPTIVYIQAIIAGEVLTTSSDASGGAASGLVVTNERVGSKLEVGFIDGDIEVGLTEDILDVTAHQTGTQIIQAVRTGRNIGNLALAMKESDAAKLKEIIEASGVAFTPPGVGATEVSAWGSEDTKSTGNISTDARKLVLHPISKVSTDYSEDHCFWRAYPLLQGVTISGENPRIINVEFKIIPDQILVKEARQYVFGDHTQNFLFQP